MTKSSVLPHLLLKRVAEAFSSDGMLSELPTYSPRVQQQEMAQVVSEAILSKEILLVEAPTGTGKTFAYLVPAILSGQRVIISTGSKNLQDQLYSLDLPRVLAALKQPVQTALLKGRHNYLCLQRLNKHYDDQRLVPWEQRPLLQEIMNWQHRTQTGEISDFAQLSEDAPIWPYVTSTRDNCLGQTCPFIDQCFLVKARRQAQTAEVVVVNHALLCADFSLKEEGMGAILPQADVVIIDEAHQFPEVASQYFGMRVTSGQVRVLISDIESEYEKTVGDRMEMIRLPGYITGEKIEIARKHLWPRQLEHAGLTGNQLKISEAAIRAIIENYAREAGVRNLEKCLSKIARKAAVKIVNHKAKHISISTNDLETYLGQPRFQKEKILLGVGIVTGLAWTALGGATLSIEAIARPSKQPGFKLTGQLGEVMKESADIAYSYIISRLKQYQAPLGFFEKHFIHIHLPEGATPKDGPSAGITLATALLSLARNQAISRTIAMSGELTLTGHVLGVGGVREKIIAARRANINEIILPLDTKGDFLELPKYIKEGLTIHFVEHYDEVYELVFG